MARSPGDPDCRAGACGEFALIERLRRLVPTAGREVVLGIGDDAAVLRLSGQILATCDIQVEGVHFLAGLSAPADIGWRALAVNLSDIAAMGGTPRCALISLAVPSETTLAVLEGIYAGLGEIARAYGVVVAGGNISRTPGPLAVDVTLLGEAGRVLGRAGAHPGDDVWITGSVGGAAAGLFLLRHPDVHVEGGEALVTAYRRPVPRVEIGRALARSDTVSALIDTSDGTASDLLHLADASGVGVRLDAARLPLPAGLAAAARAAGQDQTAWALGGGDDYELLFTAGPGFEATAAGIARATGVPVTRIGEIVPAREGRWVTGDGGKPAPLAPTGWDHFGRRAGEEQA